MDSSSAIPAQNSLAESPPSKIDPEAPSQNKSSERQRRTRPRPNPLTLQPLTQPDSSPFWKKAKPPTPKVGDSPSSDVEEAVPLLLDAKYNTSFRRQQLSVGSTTPERSVSRTGYHESHEDGVATTRQPLLSQQDCSKHVPIRGFHALDEDPPSILKDGKENRNAGLFATLVEAVGMLAFWIFHLLWKIDDLVEWIVEYALNCFEDFDEQKDRARQPDVDESSSRNNALGSADGVGNVEARKSRSSRLIWPLGSWTTDHQDGLSIFKGEETTTKT